MTAVDEPDEQAGEPAMTPAELEGILDGAANMGMRIVRSLGGTDEDIAALQTSMQSEREFQVAANTRRIVCERCKDTKYVSLDRDGFVCDECSA